MNWELSIRDRWIPIAAMLICVAAAPPHDRGANGLKSTEPPIGISTADAAAWERAKDGVRAAAEAHNDKLLTNREEEALAIAEQTFGRGSREAANYARYLANSYFTEGRFAEAAPLYERAVAAAIPMLGHDSFDTWNAVHALAQTYGKLGQHARARPLFDRAVRTSEFLMSKDDPDTLTLFRESAINLLADRTLAANAVDPARALAAAIRARRGTMAAPGLVYTTTTGQLGNRSRQVVARFDPASVRAARARANDLGAFALLAEAIWAEHDATSGTTIAGDPEALLALQDEVSGPAGQAVEAAAARLAGEHKAAGLGELVRQRQDLTTQANDHEDAETQMAGYHGEDWMQRTVALYKEGYRIEQETARIDVRLHAEFPEYYTRAANAALDTSTAQRLLAPHEAVLLIAQSPFGTQTMAITSTTLKWSRATWSNERLVGAIKRLQWDVGQEVGVDAATSAQWENEGGGGYAFDRGTAFALYQQLVAPVADVLVGKREVFVIAGGVLTSLPLGILVSQRPLGADGDPKALRATHWFADDFGLSVIPSLQSLQFLREERGRLRSSSEAFAGYGDPALSGAAEDQRGRSNKPGMRRRIFQVGQPRSGGGITNVAEIRSLPRLPGTARELEQMRLALGAPPSAVHTGERATEADFRAADLHRIGILALATHGLMGGELIDRAEPGLVFTPPAAGSDEDDGLLTASEVSTLKLDADWVILSACNTASGDGNEGAPGLSGLARAFFYAGARNLLVSHWPVRDDVASQITVDVIRRQRADPDLSRSKALRAAMRAIRNNASHDTASDSWSHPNAWAPFSLIGDGAHQSH